MGMLVVPLLTLFRYTTLFRSTVKDREKEIAIAQQLASKYEIAAQDAELKMKSAKTSGLLLSERLKQKEIKSEERRVGKESKVASIKPYVSEPNFKNPTTANVK